jgi:hypothetical protein
MPRARCACSARTCPGEEVERRRGPWGGALAPVRPGAPPAAVLGVRGEAVVGVGAVPHFGEDDEVGASGGSLRGGRWGKGARVEGGSGEGCVRVSVHLSFRGRARGCFGEEHGEEGVDAADGGWVGGQGAGTGLMERQRCSRQAANVFPARQSLTLEWQREPSVY